MTTASTALGALRVYARMALLTARRRPYKLTLLAAGGCNLRCQICSIWRTRPAANITLDEARRIWDAFPDKPCWINVAGGEPLLNPELEPILTFFAEKNQPLLITLTTNGSIDCTPIIDRVLGRAGHRGTTVYVSVSLDGEAPEHDAARGRPGAFARASRTYANLRALQARVPGLKVGVSTTISRVNQDTVLPFVARTLRENPTVTFNLAQRSEYYGNAEGDSFEALPRAGLVALLRDIGERLPKRSLDSFLKVVFLDSAIRHLEGRSRPMRCASIGSNVLVTAELDLVDCTLRFQPWADPSLSREAKLAALAAVLRDPRPRVEALRARVRAAGCEASCHAPCEKYVHSIAALLDPIRAPGLLATYARVCLASRLSRGRRARPAQGAATPVDDLPRVAGASR